VVVIEVHGEDFFSSSEEVGRAVGFFFDGAGELVAYLADAV
jgi:hypothetical protein